MKKIFLMLLVLNLGATLFAQTKEVSFTLDDRDRIMRTEQKVEGLQQEMNIKIDSLRKEMTSRIDTLYWGFGILIALMLFLFGYIVWDRRTALNPVQSKTYDLSERYFKMETALKEKAKNDPKLAEILKSVGIL